ncbi:CO dehydrogenase/CO-methylating acetyl-CoA synthase complex subunit beta [Methanospirillum sp. J.3.6.1-F.2.7.3]|uniref:Acetyl-CoA decarbonylase/synthase complex subunit beta n=1 Tax=Methanospirillum purgamenti TaxID=2834276 RepID=A0A8E7AWP5_9EURY|nr:MULTISPECIES: CO dehydrogenase/CO-methylating acetyl-CoA synthase complex subunit beta [Methanospirillum]MDX8551671.1 CO dehydrogenase/CO-methylating acetyl-CoA synthase complex subunit beta [Methanospirillum hungatei]QVV87664.1 CO dehydrogenase/CO-methylating acetyl-CoA synthase complex subunit beta [Methanospirillum sp. J.3.6.1-F.2.7.3]
MFEDIPVEVGLIHEGERIRKEEMRVELGGPKVSEKFELVLVKDNERVVDGSISVIGTDLSALEEGKSYPFGILVEVSGEKLEEDLEGVFERRIHEYLNYIQGVMHLNQRYDIWVRVGKKAYTKGLTSFDQIGRVLISLYKSELPIIEKIQISFFTGGEEFQRYYSLARDRYETRDARARGLLDEEVDTFYGCALCQSFAPSHICVITPQRYANCGAISWFDGRAAARMDPEGPIFPISKGNYLDPEHGEYSGINEHASKRSMGEVNRVWLYSAFGYPHTSCGCFEAIAFYIPEVEGFGIVHRRFAGPTVNGLAFSILADSTAGGRQVEGFHGISLEYMRSVKFLQADGGWNTIVWIPAEIKDLLAGIIPVEIADAIATEKDALDIDTLKSFLTSHRHPVLSKWIVPVEKEEESPDFSSPAPVMSIGELPLMAGGVKIILKNARIYAERIIIQPAQDYQIKQKGGRHD